MKESVFWRRNTEENGSETGKSMRTIVYSVFVSIAVLSISSHQEARFLLPAILPVLSIASYEPARSRLTYSPLARLKIRTRIKRPVACA